MPKPFLKIGNSRQNFATQDALGTSGIDLSSGELVTVTLSGTTVGSASVGQNRTGAILVGTDNKTVDLRGWQIEGFNLVVTFDSNFTGSLTFLVF